MHDLLPHFERELAELRTLTEDFAFRYPRVAGRMAVSGELLQDPHVERLLQAFALLGARVRKRLDDGHALFAQSYLGLLYPHYLRALPACAIVCFAGKETSRHARAEVLPRGHEAKALLKGQGTSVFRTTADLQMLPLSITGVGFQASANAPAGTRVPSRTMAILSLRLQLLSSQARWSDLEIETLRLYIDGPRPLVTLLRESLVSRVLATMVQTADRNGWAVDDETLPRGAGFDDVEALIDLPTGAHSVYRLLTEYFAFPEKFNFIDVPLPAAARGSTNAPMTLYFALGNLRGDADMAVLQNLTTDNLRLGCVPVINLFARRTSSQSIEPGAQSYPVVVKNATTQRACDIYAVQQVFRTRKHTDGEEDAEGDTMTAIPPFLSLSHDQGEHRNDETTAYWIEHRRTGNRPGEIEIGFVDLNMTPVDGGVEAFAADVLATDHGVSSRIQIGKPGGDFSEQPGGSWEKITFLTQPTRSLSFDTEDGKIWRLISQLSFNPLLLSGQGIQALRDVLSLYDLPGSSINQQIRSSLTAISYKPVQGFIEVDGFSSFVRGAEIMLEVNEAELVDVGLHLLTNVLGRLFALCVSTNSFTRLKLVCARTGKTLILGERRRGEKKLL